MSLCLPQVLATKILFGLFKKSLSLGSVFGTVTWTWAGESRHCASIPNTGQRFFSSTKCPHWICGQSSFLFKEHEG